ncbi:MAG: AsmA family protein [Sulfurimicrobium sp.]|nr:AsmA family protein [Sulfurimicrobium sp.]
MKALIKKYLKYGLAVLAGAGVLLVLLLVVASLLINPNDYKPQIVQMVKEKKQRTLTLAGDIKLAFLPKLGLDLGRASVSEYRGEKEFASVESARLYLSWWPLLKKELVVDQVRIEGVRANLVRFKDGTTNFDDLLQKEEEDKQIKFDIDSVMIGKSALSFRDEMGGRQLALSDIQIKTGRLANGKPTEVAADFNLQSDNPRVNARFHVTSGLTFDTEARRYAVKGMKLEIQGEAAGLSKLGVGLKGDAALDQTAGTLLVENLAAAVAGKKGTDDIDVRLTAPRLQWAADKMATEKIELVAKVQQSAGGEMGLVASIPSITGDSQSFKAGMLNVDVSAVQSGAEYKGKLSSPLSGNFKDQHFVLSDLKGNLAASDKKMPGGGMKLDIAGSAQLDLQPQSATVNLTSRLDESNIKLKAGISPFANPHIALDLDIDRIDADRYLPAKAPQSQSQPEKPFDFSLLKTLNASGSVRVGSLKLYNIKASNVRLEFKAGGGQLDVSPLAASLYQGTASGAMSLNAAGPRVTARQNISGVSIAPLLKDALDKDILEGKGNVNFDLRAEGGSVGAMKKTLQGKAGLNLRDGAVKGINIAARLREAKAGLGALKGEKTQAANAQEKTDFSELSASFDINRGVAHNDDLSAKSPLLRVAGNGDIDVGAEMLNYLARATVVGSLEGQGGRELAALKGVTVPLRINGPFAAPKLTLDFNSLVSESVKQEVKARAADKLKDGLKGLFR